MGWLFASVQYLPFFVCSAVLGGFALWGWRRSRATGALLIAVSAGLGIVHHAFGVYSMWRLWNRGVGGSTTFMTMFGVVQSAGAFIAEVLLIVGVALVLRRLPAMAKR